MNEQVTDSWVLPREKFWNETHCEKMSCKKMKRSKWSVSLQLYILQLRVNNRKMKIISVWTHIRTAYVLFFMRMNEWIWIKIETLDFDNQHSRAKHEKIYSSFFLFSISFLFFYFFLLTHFPFPCSFSFLLSSTSSNKSRSIYWNWHACSIINFLYFMLLLAVPSQSQGLMSIVISQNIHTHIKSHELA